MKPRIQVLRALTSRYALDVLNPILKWGIAILMVICVGIALLAYKVDPWWLLLYIPIVVVAVPICIVGLIAHVVAHLIAPEMSVDQRKAVRAYVDNMKDVAEGLQTPQFMIVFKVAKDVLTRKWETGFVQGMTTNTLRLKTDFDRLVELFNQRTI